MSAVVFPFHLIPAFASVAKSKRVQRMLAMGERRQLAFMAAPRHILGDRIKQIQIQIQAQTQQSQKQDSRH